MGAARLPLRVSERPWQPRAAGGAGVRPAGCEGGGTPRSVPSGRRGTGFKRPKPKGKRASEGAEPPGCGDVTGDCEREGN